MNPGSIRAQMSVARIRWIGDVAPSPKEGGVPPPPAGSPLMRIRENTRTLPHPAMPWRGPDAGVRESPGILPDPHKGTSSRRRWHSSLLGGGSDIPDPPDPGYAIRARIEPGFTFSGSNRSPYRAPFQNKPELALFRQSGELKRSHKRVLRADHH